jgi:hypothetical protein
VARISFRPLDTSVLTTVDETVDDLAALAGTFVRIRPTASASDEQLRTLKRELLKAGALAVRLLPRPQGDELQLSAPAALVASAFGSKLDTAPPVRDLMAKLVEASTSHDKPALLTLLNRLADEEGL